MKNLEHMQGEEWNGIYKIIERKLDLLLCDNSLMIYCRSNEREI